MVGKVKREDDGAFKPSEACALNVTRSHASQCAMITWPRISPESLCACQGYFFYLSHSFGLAHPHSLKFFCNLLRIAVASLLTTNLHHGKCGQEFSR